MNLPITLILDAATVSNTSDDMPGAAGTGDIDTAGSTFSGVILDAQRTSGENAGIQAGGRGAPQPGSKLPPDDFPDAGAALAILSGELTQFDAIDIHPPTGVLSDSLPVELPVANVQPLISGGEETGSTPEGRHVGRDTATRAGALVATLASNDSFDSDPLPYGAISIHVSTANSAPTSVAPATGDRGQPVSTPGESHSSRMVATYGLAEREIPEAARLQSANAQNLRLSAEPPANRVSLNLSTQAPVANSSEVVAVRADTRMREPGLTLDGRTQTLASSTGPATVRETSASNAAAFVLPRDPGLHLPARASNSRPGAVVAQAQSLSGARLPVDITAMALRGSDGQGTPVPTRLADSEAWLLQQAETGSTRPVTEASANRVAAINGGIAEPSFRPVVSGTSTSSPLLSTSIAAPVLDPAWGDALQERVFMLASRGVRQAQISLNPAELGPLRVRISVDENIANVSFTAAHAVTRDALEVALPKLKEMFAEQGLSLSNTDVSEHGVDERKQEDDGSSLEFIHSEADELDSDESTADAGNAKGRVPAGLIDAYV